MLWAFEKVIDEKLLNAIRRYFEAVSLDPDEGSMRMPDCEAFNVRGLCGRIHQHLLVMIFCGPEQQRMLCGLPHKPLPHYYYLQLK